MREDSAGGRCHCSLATCHLPIKSFPLPSAFLQCPCCHPSAPPPRPLRASLQTKASAHLSSLLQIPFFPFNGRAVGTGCRGGQVNARSGRDGRMWCGRHLSWSPGCSLAQASYVPPWPLCRARSQTLAAGSSQPGLRPPPSPTASGAAAGAECCAAVSSGGRPG